MYSDSWVKIKNFNYPLTNTPGGYIIYLGELIKDGK